MTKKSNDNGDTNVTPPSTQASAPRPAAESFNIKPEDLLTEQEKDKGEGKGVGPVSPSVPSPGPVETMENLGIGPREPYPTGGAGADKAGPGVNKEKPL